MNNSVWLAIALVLMIEGIGPVISPRGWKRTILEISKVSDNNLRRIGGCLVVIGIVIFYLL